MKHLKYLLPLLLLSAHCVRAEAPRPRIVVQIVVSSMRSGDLDRYAANFGAGGFRRLTDEGAYFTDARYDYQQTTTPVSLATLSTGALPSTHGVVASRWRDYVENKTVYLASDRAATGLDYPDGGGNYSPRNLVVPTLGETLLQHSPRSRIATVALEPESAVVMGGRAGLSFWMASDKCHWRSSSFYMPVLPEWVRKYNRERTPQVYLMPTWSTLLPEEYYLNPRRCDIVPTTSATKARRSPKRVNERFATCASDLSYTGDYDRMAYTPAGNTATLAFAKILLAQLNMGGDEDTDLLNICLDTPRHIAEAYGPESVEAEDMYYRLDRDLEDFLTYLYAQVKPGEAVVVLTSDHGTSDSYDFGPRERDRFNVPQFEMILNTFLSARYGQGDWLLEYEDRMIWLNHNLVYEKKLSLADVQNEVATFAMQFRGVSHALSATAMRTSYFGSGYARKMQNGFYPRRSGDVMLNLMPGWIEQRDRCRSHSGSMYGYDTRVPLLIHGGGIAHLRSEEPVEMTSVAPTLARLTGIPEPAASEGTPLAAIIRNR